jgi:predicted RNA binding protein YcfA (HicA-like mRNA interferase family)
MSKKGKLLQKLADADKTFAWTDLVTLLSQLGFEKVERAGSRVVFIHIETEYSMYLHKPHPENDIKGGALKAVKHHLTNRGDL